MGKVPHFVPRAISENTTTSKVRPLANLAQQTPIQRKLDPLHAIPVRLVERLLMEVFVVMYVQQEKKDPEGPTQTVIRALDVPRVFGPTATRKYARNAPKVFTRAILNRAVAKHVKQVDTTQTKRVLKL